MNFLINPICAVHCVHLTDSEIQMAKEKEVSIVYNPKSNAKLGSGISPIVTYLKKGIPVSLATDGAASNDVLDMFEEMCFGVMLQKLKYERADIFLAEEIFRMATEVGAKILEINAGILEEGKLSDIVLDISQVHIQPIHNIIQQIVYCGKANDVNTVIINGKVVMENKKICTIDEEKIVSTAVRLGGEKYIESRKHNLVADF